MPFWNGKSCEGVPPPSELSLITAVYSLLLALVTIPGNFLVCLAIYKDPQKKLRTPFNYFVLSLSVADLIVGTVTEPISVWHHLREWRSLAPDKVEIIHMSYFISCTASVLNLAALSIDRHFAISFPLQYRTKLNPKRATIASLLIWITAITLPFIYFYVGYIKYAFVFANTAIILTFAVLIFTSLRSVQTLKQHVLRWDQPTEVLTYQRTRRQRQQEAKVTKVFIMMLVVFIFCYTPSCVMIYVMNFCESCSCISIHWMRDLQFLFVLLSSSCNPFIYSLRLKNFRKAFDSILSCSCDRLKVVGRLLGNPLNADSNHEAVSMVSIKQEDNDESSVAKI